MDISNEEIGKRIREIRKDHSLTQEQLAELADISVDFLSLVETGRSSMSVQNLAKIASTLDVTSDYLIYGKTAYKENEKINIMLAALPSEIQKQVEKMITVFVDSLRISTKKLSEKSNSKKK